MFNNSSNLYGSEWLALVFNNRNKNYGAFVLRSQSAIILLKSFLMVVPLFVLLFVGPLIYIKLNPATKITVVTIVPIVTPDLIHENKKIAKPKIKVKEAVAAKPVAKPKTIAMSANVVVVNKETAPPPTLAQTKDAVIASTTENGITGVQNATVTDKGTVSNGTAPTGEAVDNSIHNNVGLESYPEFPGGMAAWAKFIQKNLRYPYQAQDAAIQGKVVLSFVIEKDGTITDVSVVRGIGYGCDDEAVRVIKKSPKWKAGKQNDENVRVRYTMPIAYTLSL